MTAKDKPEADAAPEGISTPLMAAADKAQAMVHTSALTAFDDKSFLAAEKRGLSAPTDVCGCAVNALFKIGQ